MMIYLYCTVVTCNLFIFETNEGLGKGYSPFGTMSHSRDWIVGFEAERNTAGHLTQLNFLVFP